MGAGKFDLTIILIEHQMRLYGYLRATKVLTSHYRRGLPHETKQPRSSLKRNGEEMVDERRQHVLSVRDPKVAYGNIKGWVFPSMSTRDCHRSPNGASNRRCARSPAALHRANHLPALGSPSYTGRQDRRCAPYRCLRTHWQRQRKRT
jgi:hypothetical protein